MAKQTGYNRVAAIKGVRTPFLFYALYDNNIKVGDMITVTGLNAGRIFRVESIIQAEDICKVFDKDLTEEVICKLDCSAYYERLKQRREAEKKEQRINILKDKINKVGSEYRKLMSEYATLTVEMK